jgi:hypothetical protein
MKYGPGAFMARWADWFDSRGVYVPGEDSKSISPWRDFGWVIAGWLATVGLFVVFFAFAS